MQPNLLGFRPKQVYVPRVAPSEPAAALDPDIVDFIHGGVMAGVVTRDDGLKPAFARAWAPRVSEDGLTLTLCVPAPEGSAMRSNLEGNGAVAVGFSPPTIARAVQLKGVATAVREPEPAELELIDRHFERFQAECDRIGAPREVSGRMLDRTGLVTVTFPIAEAFEQTPGPTAGRRL